MPLLIVQKNRWVLGPVWMGGENLATHQKSVPEQSIEANRYTDCAIRAHKHITAKVNKELFVRKDYVMYFREVWIACFIIWKLRV